MTSPQAFEGWIREENVEALLRLHADAAGIVIDLPAVLDALLDTDPARGRWASLPDETAALRLRLGREPGTGVVELLATPQDWGADALVARLRVLCAVMQAWTLVRAPTSS